MGFGIGLFEFRRRIDVPLVDLGNRLLRLAKRPGESTNMPNGQFDKAINDQPWIA
jgi:hypothetical protein